MPSVQSEVQVTVALSAHQFLGHRVVQKLDNESAQVYLAVLLGPA